MSEPLYFEDVYVGQVFRSESAVMERDRLVAFAEEFDPQPQHLSEEQALGSLFGTLVASGWHTAALSMRLQHSVIMRRVPGGAMGAQVDKLAWRRPVLPGDRLHVVCEVLAVRPSKSRPERGLVTVRTVTMNQNEEPVMDMEAAIMLPRKALAAT